MTLPTETPAPLNLPNPKHLARMPSHLGADGVARIKQAAYLLPQVVKPADYLDEGSKGFEAHLDKLGLVQLQKPAPGGRPSRWIAPELMDSALAHLDAVGTGPDARALMLARTAELETLGLTRRAGLWTRLAQQELVLEGGAGCLQVAHRVALDTQALWAFYRDGDAARLLTSLGPLPPHPQALELQAHLERLLARSEALNPQQLPSLLPRLQAECATPQAPAELMAACSRAQDRWEHGVAEQDTLQGLNRELAFQGYPDTFPKARRAQRQISLYVGPPNSGKTHAAFERLALAGATAGQAAGAAPALSPAMSPARGQRGPQLVQGAYLAPLRLLALEGRDRLVARGVPCSLLTGEENVPAEGARVVSSTIEMVSTNTLIDVAVIDEAQMIFDASRGWAWTQAIVAVPAKELIIICSSYAVPAIESLLGLCGERCTVRHFERKQHVQLLPQPVPLSSLQLGDAVVAFSRREVLMLRDAIAANGHPVSVIYGALPPEVRRREAERFSQGASHVLVATDAIGMGLNLPIRRVLFSTMTKFDGQSDRTLDESEVHQIAGRAGRFGIHEEGFVGVLKDAEPEALRQLKDLLARQPRAPRDFKAPVAPNGWHVDTISSRLHKTRLHEVLGVFMQQLRLDDAHFAVAELEQMLDLASELDKSASRLTLKERFTYAQAPVDMRADALVKEFLEWSHRHSSTGHAGRPWFLDDVDGHSRLERMEQALRGCTLWLWLDLRFPRVYGHVEEVQALRSALNDGIERQLKGKRPLAQVRSGQRKPRR